MSSLRSWPWWLHTRVVSLLLNSSSSLSSRSIVAAAFPCGHRQGSRGISPCLCTAVSWIHWWILQQYEPLGREEGKIFRRASLLQLDLSRLAGRRDGGRRNNRKLTCSDLLQWVSGQLPWWDVPFCYCIFTITCEGTSCAGLLQGPVVVEILTEGIVLS